MKIEIKICDVVYTLEEARELYEELRKLFDKRTDFHVPSDVFIRGGLVNNNEGFKIDNKINLDYVPNTKTTSVTQ